jgi:hypothetical protein
VFHERKSIHDDPVGRLRHLFYFGKLSTASFVKLPPFWKHDTKLLPMLLLLFSSLSSGREAGKKPCGVSSTLSPGVQSEFSQDDSIIIIFQVHGKNPSGE